jgi:hypothetical protein
MTRSMTILQTLGVFLASLTVSAAVGGSAGCKKAHAKVKGVGDTLQAFIIRDAGTGERYCQVCAYGGRPTIFAVGDIDDAGFAEDLVKIQALLDEHRDAELSAFALYGKIAEGRFAPLPDEDGALAKLAALRTERGLTMPVTIVPNALTDKEKANYAPFTEVYEIAKSRTVMMAKANNQITWVGQLDGSDAGYAALAEAVKKGL